MEREHSNALPRDDEREDAVRAPSDPLLHEAGDSASYRLGTSHARSNRRLLLYGGPALLLCHFVVGFDISFLSTNYSRRIASSLHDLNNVGWIILAGSVTESACQPLYAHFAQVYDRKSATLIASAAIALGLLFCSLSYQLWQLTLSRVVTGTGTSGIPLLVIIIINDLVEIQDVPLWKSIVIIAQTCALMLGGPLGSTFTDQLGWHATFAMEFCLMLIAILAVCFTLHLPTPDKHPQTSKHIDFAGGISLFCAIAMPLFAVNIGGNILPWNHPVVVILLCFTPFALFLFYFVESYLAKTPIILGRLLRIPSALASLTCTFAIVFAFNQLLWSYSLYAEARSFDQASRFNDWGLTFVYLGRPIGAVISGLLVKRFLQFKPILQLDMVAMVLVYLAFAAGWIQAENPVSIPVLILVGVNVGVSESCIPVSLLSVVERQDQPQILALSNLTDALAIDISVGMSMALTRFFVKSKLIGVLGSSPSTDETLRKCLESLEYVRSLPPDLQKPVIKAFISSIENVFEIACGVLLLSVVGSFFVREMRDHEPGHAPSEHTRMD